MSRKLREKASDFPSQLIPKRNNRNKERCIPEISARKKIDAIPITAIKR